MRFNCCDRQSVGDISDSRSTGTTLPKSGVKSNEACEGWVDWAIADELGNNIVSHKGQVVKKSFIIDLKYWWKLSIKYELDGN